MPIELTIKADSAEEIAEVAQALAGRPTDRLAWEERGRLLAAGWRGPTFGSWHSPDGRGPLSEFVAADLAELRRAAAGSLTGQTTAPSPESAPSAPIPGPTARDAAAGMLLRCDFAIFAADLAQGRSSARELAEALHWKSKLFVPPPERSACIAALEALAAREACRGGHGGDGACAECAPGEQAERGSREEIEALRKSRDDLQRNLIDTLQEYSALVRKVRAALGTRPGLDIPEAVEVVRREAREQGAAEMRERAAVILDRMARFGGVFACGTLTSYRELAEEIRALPISPAQTAERVAREGLDVARVAPAAERPPLAAGQRWLSSATGRTLDTKPGTAPGLLEARDTANGMLGPIIFAIGESAPAHWVFLGSTTEPKAMESAPAVRIERRADGEYLVGMPDEPNDCPAELDPSDDNTRCCWHLDGQHVAVGGRPRAADGAWPVAARWPIAPAPVGPTQKPDIVEAGSVWTCVGIAGELEVLPADDRLENGRDVSLAPVERPSGRAHETVRARAADMLGLKEWTFVRGPGTPDLAASEVVPAAESPLALDRAIHESVASRFSAHDVGGGP